MDQSLLDAFKYYLAHQDEFVDKYNGRVIALKGRRVLGDYEDELTAITETQKNEKLGTFIVQRVTPGEDAYTIRVNTRVVFS